MTRRSAPAPPYRDRTHAGRVLADHLDEFRNRGVVVLALPRGGVPVAEPVARRLHAPLDVYLVRKLGVPTQPELAAGREDRPLGRQPRGIAVFGAREGVLV